MLREHAHGGSNPPIRTSRRAKSRRNKRGHGVAVSARLVVAQQVRVQVPLVTPRRSAAARVSERSSPRTTRCSGSNSRLQNAIAGVQLPSSSLRNSCGYRLAVQDRRFSIVVRGFDSRYPRHLPSLVDPVPGLRILVTDVQFVPRVPTPVERLSTLASEAGRDGSTPSREAKTYAR